MEGVALGVIGKWLMTNVPHSSSKWKSLPVFASVGMIFAALAVFVLHKELHPLFTETGKWTLEAGQCQHLLPYPASHVCEAFNYCIPHLGKSNMVRRSF